MDNSCRSQSDYFRTYCRKFELIDFRGEHTLYRRHISYKFQFLLPILAQVVRLTKHMSLSRNASSALICIVIHLVLYFVVLVYLCVASVLISNALIINLNLKARHCFTLILWYGLCSLVKTIPLLRIQNSNKSTVPLL